MPVIDRRSTNNPDCTDCMEEILQIRHHSLYAPRDFDVSPYFQVVKPSIEIGFNFHALRWVDTPLVELAFDPCKQSILSYLINSS